MVVGALYTTASTDDVVNHLQKYKFLHMLAALSLLADPQIRRHCWWAFMSMVFLTVALSFANLVWDMPWSRSNGTAFGVDHSIFKDYISQGAMTALLMVSSLARGAGAVHWRRWAWWTLAAACFVCNTQLLLGRTAYLATGVAVAAFFFALMPPRRWAHVAGALVLVLGTAVWVSPGILPRFELVGHEMGDWRTDTPSSTGNRMYLWEKSAELIEARPLAGWGTGAYHDQFCRVATTPAWCASGRFHPHNQFLFFMVEYGLLGLVAFGALFVGALRQARRLDPWSRAVVCGFTGVVFVGSMTHSAFYLSTEGLIYGFGWMLVLSAPVAARRPLGSAP